MGDFTVPVGATGALYGYRGRVDLDEVFGEALEADFAEDDGVSACGEVELTHWHGTDESFADRKPL